MTRVQMLAARPKRVSFAMAIPVLNESVSGFGAVSSSILQELPFAGVTLSAMRWPG